MITLKDTSYSYTRHGFPAVAHVNAEIGPGVFLLLGENGAGKTTLLNLLAGLLIPTEGECLLDGAEIARRKPSTASRIAMLEAEPTTPFRDIENLVKYHSPFYPCFDPTMLRASLAEFGISATQKFSSMSPGMRQKTLVSYFLSLNTSLLLLDEPVNGLDIESKELLQRLIAQCSCEDRTIIISTHTISDLSTVYDGVMVMKSGRLMLSASTEAILKKIRFVSAYTEATGAIYSELRAGLVRSIVPATAGGCSEDLDFHLLYKALHSPVAPTLLSLLNGSYDEY